MFRLAKVGLAIIIVVSVAGVLITPDSSDDVDGALQRTPFVKATAVVGSVAQTQSTPFVFPRVAPVVLQRLASTDLLDLVCVRLC